MIDKNIPMPEVTSKRGKWVELAKKMEIGDSFLDVDATSSSCGGSKAFNSIYQWGRANGAKFTSRKQEAGGVRIWRIS